MTQLHLFFVGVLLSCFVSACNWSDDLDERLPFLGLYEAEEIQYNHATLAFDTMYYELEITKEGTEDILLNGLTNGGLYSTGCTITATVGGLRLVIPDNLCDLGNGVYYEFSGSGTLDATAKELVISLEPNRCKEDINSSYPDCTTEQVVSIRATKQ